MIRYIAMALFVGAMAFNVGCASKKKEVGVGDVEADPSIATRDMSFDPMGSDSGEIEGLSTVNFGFDNSSLSTEARRLLAQNAEWMRANPQVTVQIEGHCDDRGSIEYNLALGERRAQSAKNYLVSLGVPDNRLTIISYGKERPLVAQAQNEADHSRNRRANFVPIPVR